MSQNPICNLNLVKVGEELLSPKVDFVFKNLFGSDENIHLTSSFLEGILKRPESDFKELKFLDPTLEREYEDDKKGILDILIELKDGTNINIELQVLEKTDFSKRVLFYNGKLITRQAKKGKSYHSISKTIIVLVLNFELICDSMKYIHQFTYYDKVNNVELTDLSEIITIELPKLGITENTDNRFNEEKLLPWLEFISADNREDVMIALEKYPELQDAYEKLEILSYDEDRVIEYNKRLMWFYDEVSKLECMKEYREELQKVGEELKDTLTELQDTQTELQDTQTELQDTQTELQDTQIELQELKNNFDSKTKETANEAIKMGLDVLSIIKLTGLSKTEIESLETALVKN